MPTTTCRKCGAPFWVNRHFTTSLCTPCQALVKELVGRHMTITASEPNLIRAADGYWLAISPSDAPVNVGVMEATESLARQEFTAAIRRVKAALAPTS